MGLPLNFICLLVYVWQFLKQSAWDLVLSDLFSNSQNKHKNIFITAIKSFHCVLTLICRYIKSSQLLSESFAAAKVFLRVCTKYLLQASSRVEKRGCPKASPWDTWYWAGYARLWNEKNNQRSCQFYNWEGQETCWYGFCWKVVPENLQDRQNELICEETDRWVRWS